MLEDQALVTLLGETKEGRVGFARGKDTVSPEAALPAGSLREARNVDIDRAGRVRRRAGFTRRYAGAGIHSLWGDGTRAFFVAGGALKRLLPDWTAKTLQSGLAPDRLLSYELVNGEVWWSNGEASGRIGADDAVRPWGVSAPAGQPLLAPLAHGGLDAGTYQVAVTFARADGEESGTGLAAVVDVPQGGGIELSAIPQGAADRIRVYASPPNGEALLLHGELPMGTTGAVLARTIRGRRLETQLTEPLPAGQIVRHYNARMWIAADRVLYASLPFRYALYRPHQDYFLFPARITVLEPVADGLFVVADATYFLAGAGPEQMALRTVDDAGGVEGTGARVPARHVGVEVPGEVAYWLGTRGAVLGLPGGGLKAVTEDRVALPAYAAGATLAREREGIRQLVTTVREPGPASGFGVSDAVVVEVRRNGVLLS